MSISVVNDLLELLPDFNGFEQHSLVVMRVFFDWRLKFFYDFLDSIVSFAVFGRVRLQAMWNVRQFVSLLTCGARHGSCGGGSGWGVGARGNRWLVCGLPALVVLVHLLPLFKQQIFHLCDLLKDDRVIWCLPLCVRLVVNCS